MELALFFRQIHGAPEIPRGGGAVGLPAFAEGEERSGLGHGALLVGQPEAVADAEIVHGQDVRAAELENQEHLNGPASDATRFGEPHDDFLVVQLGDVAGGRDGAVQGLGGDVADGGDLGEREAARADLGVGDAGQIFRAGKPPAGKEFFEAGEDGVGGGAVQLLVGDGLDEGLERRATGLRLEFAGAGLADEPAHDGIHGGEMF